MEKNNRNRIIMIKKKVNCTVNKSAIVVSLFFRIYSFVWPVRQNVYVVAALLEHMPHERGQCSFYIEYEKFELGRELFHVLVKL